VKQWSVKGLTMSAEKDMNPEAQPDMRADAFKAEVARRLEARFGVKKVEPGESTPRHPKSGKGV